MKHMLLMLYSYNIITKLFRKKGIRYLFFWGWEQINVKNQLSDKFKELYKTTEIGEWWIPRNHIGFKEPHKKK